MFHVFFYILFVFVFNVFGSFEMLVQDLDHFHGLQSQVPAPITQQVKASAKQFNILLRENLIRGRYNVDISYKDIKVRSDRINYTLKNNVIYVYKNVFVTKDDMTLSCNSSKISFPKWINVYGDVKFNYRDYHSISEEALYNIKTNLISLEGKAHLTHGLDFVKGDKIIFDVEKQKVVSKGRSKINFSTKRI